MQICCVVCLWCVFFYICNTFHCNHWLNALLFSTEWCFGTVWLSWCCRDCEGGRTPNEPRRAAPRLEQRSEVVAGRRGQTPNDAAGVRTLIENNVFKFERHGATRRGAALRIRCATPFTVCSRHCWGFYAEYFRVVDWPTLCPFLMRRYSKIFPSCCYVFSSDLCPHHFSTQTDAPVYHAFSANSWKEVVKNT